MTDFLIYRHHMNRQSWPLTLDRAYYESEALMAAFKRCPTYSPEVYHADRTMATIVMRYIGETRCSPAGMLTFYVSRRSKSIDFGWTFPTLERSMLTRFLRARLGREAG